MIAICSNPFRDADLAMATHVGDILKQEGFQSEFFKVFDDEDSKISTNAKKIDFAIVIGGDGTILRVARELFGYSVPLLGVNLGTMGFMASIEASQIESIPSILKDGYRKSVRMMLDVSLMRGEECIYSGACLNDAVIHGYGDVINTKSYTRGALISNFDGDGIILATPTGSTGYAMSAGGPIVEPEARAIELSPICAHTLRGRSLLLSHESVIETVTSRLRGRKAYLSVDGVYITNVRNNDKLIVRESKSSTIIASTLDYNFFDTAYSKLG